MKLEARLRCERREYLLQLYDRLLDRKARHTKAGKLLGLTEDLLEILGAVLWG